MKRLLKRFGRRRGWILNHVDLELPGGSVTLVTGSNGCGKSTLLRIIAGLSRPTSGSVHRTCAAVAVVPDRFIPPTRMTGASYLRHHGRVRGLNSATADRRANELAERFRLVPGMDAPMDELSKGNAQKLALTQAFLAPVGLLVLDEPGTALDAHAAVTLEALINEACSSGTTVVMSDPTSSGDRPGAHCYELTDGRVRPTAPTPRASEPPSSGWVGVLLRPSPAAGPPERLATLHAGAVSPLTADGALMHATVSAELSDEFLAGALADGWSVLEIRPTACARGRSDR